MFFQRSSARLTGSTLIELAIALPVALFVAVAALDVANVIRAQGVLHEGLKAAARCMTATDGSCAAVAAVLSPEPGALFNVTLSRTQQGATFQLQTAPATLNVPYVYFTRALPAYSGATSGFQGAVLSGPSQSVGVPPAFSAPTYSASFPVPELSPALPDPTFDYDCLVAATSLSSAAAGALQAPANPLAAARCEDVFNPVSPGTPSPTPSPNLHPSALAVSAWRFHSFPTGGLQPGRIPTAASFHSRYALLTVAVDGEVLDTNPTVTSGVEIELHHMDGHGHSLGRMELGGQAFPPCLQSPPVSPAPSPAPLACPRQENFALRGHYRTHGDQQYLIPVLRGEQYRFRFNPSAGTTYRVTRIQISFTSIAYASGPRLFDCPRLAPSQVNSHDIGACSPLTYLGAPVRDVAIPDPAVDTHVELSAAGAYSTLGAPEPICGMTCQAGEIASLIQQPYIASDYNCSAGPFKSCGEQVTPLGQSCSPQALCASVPNQDPSAHCVASFIRNEPSCPVTKVQRNQASVNGAQALEAFYGTLEAAMPATRNCTGNARCATISPDPSTFAPGTHRSVALNARYEVPLFVTLGQSSFPVQASYTDAFEHSAVR